MRRPAAGARGPLGRSARTTASGRSSPGTASSGEGGSKRLDLVVLMLEQPQQDLLERPLPVTEPEAVLGRDAIELFISELSDPGEVVARAGQPLADLARVSFGGEPPSSFW